MIRNKAGAAAFVVLSLLALTPTASAAVQYRLEPGTLKSLAAPHKPGAKFRVNRVPLTDGEPSTLVLERFDVWNENADIKVFGADGKVEKIAPPAATYFRGEVEGDADSIVFFSLEDGRYDGLVYSNNRKFAIGDRLDKSGNREMVVHETSVTDELEDSGSFTCEVEKSPVVMNKRPRARTDAAGMPVTQAAPTGTQRSVINIAVDTDYELFVNSGSTQANVTTFIGNLIAAASTIYNRDLLTEIRISYLGIQTSAVDPFNIVPGQNNLTSIDALLELGDRWHNAAPSTNARSAVTLISGKPQLAGVAWLQTLCDPDFQYNGHWGGRYSYCGGIDPPNSLTVPNPDAPNYAAPSSNYWPLLQFSHELGHNVGSSHTHCVGLTNEQKTQYNVSRNYVDECYNAEGGCFGGTMSVPVEKGTIMSYCHLRSGTGLNTRFTFGQPNEVSNIIRNNMRTYMANVTPPLSAITAPANLANGATGNASVGAVAGLTYSWAITNGTITSSANANAITFTGTANPITLRVTATNAQGCAVTDTIAVTYAGSTIPAPGGIAATAIGSTSVNVAWTAATGATGYQIWRSADAINYVQVGTTAASSFVDNSAAPNTAYLYKVRGTADSATGAYSASDLATTVIFIDGALVPGGSTAKLVHFTQLQQAVNAVRALVGIAPMAFSAPAPANGVSIRKAHLDELRNGLNAARNGLGIGAISFVDPVVTAGVTPIRATHIVQLRSGTI